MLLKALDTFWQWSKSVVSLVVSQHVHKITSTQKFELNFVVEVAIGNVYLQWCVVYKRKSNLYAIPKPELLRMPNSIFSWVWVCFVDDWEFKFVATGFPAWIFAIIAAKDIDGWGWKPTAGTASLPVENTNISLKVSDDIWSRKNKLNNWAIIKS